MLFRELVDQEGMTAIIVTHDVLVEGIADRIVHLHQGRLIAETSPRKNGSVRRIVDPSGWLAPDLPSPPAALSRTAVTPRGEIVVRLQDVGRSYGRGVRTITAIRTLNAQIPRGGIHVVTGPSGSGKSTLLRLMIGLDRPTSGTVEALGLNLEDLDRTALAKFRAAHVSTVS
ncbi:MAG: ATP-binding cassette domain-containing protein, partial [Deltaproteobacteria bacterium]